MPCKLFQVWISQCLRIVAPIPKLDGVALLITDPQETSFTTLYFFYTTDVTDVMDMTDVTAVADVTTIPRKIGRRKKIFEKNSMGRGQHSTHIPTDVATTRLNRPQGRFSENVGCPCLPLRPLNWICWVQSSVSFACLALTLLGTNFFSISLFVWNYSPIVFSNVLSWKSRIFFWYWTEGQARHGKMAIMVIIIVIFSCWAVLTYGLCPHNLFMA